MPLITGESPAPEFADDDRFAARIRYKEALLSETREELAKADSKASILLAASGIAAAALLMSVGAGTWSPGRLHQSSARIMIWFAMGFGLAGIVLLAGAVKPRLRARAMDKSRLHYFGNIRAHWPLFSPLVGRQSKMEARRKTFVTALNNASTELNYDARLDDQLWFLGRSAFRKYRLIMVSLWSLGAAIGLGIATLLLEVL